MKLPVGCLSVSSVHLSPESAEFLAAVHPSRWPFPGGAFGNYTGWLCQCEPFSLPPSLDPFNGLDIIAAFELAASLEHGWVMFHQSGVRRPELPIYRKFEGGVDPFLFGRFLKADREAWRRKTEEWLASLSRTDPIF